MSSPLCVIVSFLFDIAQIMVNLLYGLGPMFGVNPPDLRLFVGSIFGCDV